MTFALLIFAGALLCNCIPHLVAGLQGISFPTPFAKPRGIARSPSLVNFAWGSANLLLGLFLALRRLPHAAPITGPLALALGFLAVGTYLSMRFGRARRAASAQASASGDDTAGSAPNPPHFRG